MFGYIRPVKEELRLKDYDRYHAAYCGICRMLGRNYGFFSRFFVNYDMTFLYLLLASTEAARPIRRCYCPARVACRKPCVDDPALMDFVAAADVILCRHKLEDDISDSGFFRALACRAAKLVTARGYRRAQKRLPDFDRTVRDRLDDLRELERQKSDSIDRTADAFAAILSACAEIAEDPGIKRPLSLLLYHVGRYVYLVDALDDLKQDCKTDAYNPLRYRFRPEDGVLGEQDAAYLGDLLNASVNLAGSAYELLPVVCDGEILENIIYYGLPQVYRAVQSGSFHPNAKRTEERRTR